MSEEGEPSEKFWRLERKIQEDKKSVGVIAEVTRKKMETTMIALIRENVIGWDDLESFSEELIKTIEYIIKNFKKIHKQMFNVCFERLYISIRDKDAVDN